MQFLALKCTVFRLVQPLKALPMPMPLSVVGNVIVSRLVQFLKTPLPMASTAPKSMDFRLVQFWNARLLISFSDRGNLISFRLEHPEKAK